MSTFNYTTLMEHLAALPDSRKQRGRRYEWQYLLGLTVFQTIGGLARAGDLGCFHPSPGLTVFQTPGQR